MTDSNLRISFPEGHKEYCSDFENKTQPKPLLRWKCERCGKLIPYMTDFCHECADELLGESPKPFEPPVERGIQ